jgi:hypothetical protein
MSTSPCRKSYDHRLRDITCEEGDSDPWIEGAPRFRMMPVVLTGAERTALYRAGEAIVRTQLG